MPSARPFALIILLLSASVLGLAPILVRLSETGPAAAGFWRLVFAVPLLLVLTARPGGEGVGRPDRWMLLAGAFFALDMAFWHYGLRMTSVANATVLCNLTPIVVTVFGWLVFRERPKRLFLLALALAIGGAVAMALGAAKSVGANPLLGDLFSISVTLWYSGYFLAVKAARKRSGALRITLWAALAGLPLMGAIAAALGEPILPSGAGGWWACLGLGLVHVFGQGGVAWALGRLPAAVTAVTVLIQPVVAALLGWLVFRETLTAPQAIGGAVVLGAVVLAQWSTRLRSSPQTKTGAKA